MSNMALNLVPFGRWTLRDKTAYRRLAVRWALMYRDRLRIAILVFSLLTTFNANAEPCDWKLATDRLGPLKIGMTLSQAQKAIGMPLDLEAKDLEITGDYLYKPRHCPCAFRALFTSDSNPKRLAVIFALSITTVDELPIGTPEYMLKHLSQTYGKRLEYSEYDHYSSRVHSYAVTPVDEPIYESAFYAPSALVYFAPNGTVNQIRAGSSRAVFRVDLLTPNPSIHRSCARSRAAR